MGRQTDRWRLGKINKKWCGRTVESFWVLNYPFSLKFSFQFKEKIIWWVWVFSPMFSIINPTIKNVTFPLTFSLLKFFHSFYFHFNQIQLILLPFIAPIHYFHFEPLIMGELIAYIGNMWKSFRKRPQQRKLFGCLCLIRRI